MQKTSPGDAGGCLFLVFLPTAGQFLGPLWEGAVGEADWGREMRMPSLPPSKPSVLTPQLRFAAQPSVSTGPPHRGRQGRVAARWFVGADDSVRPVCYTLANTSASTSPHSGRVSRPRVMPSCAPRASLRRSVSPSSSRTKRLALPWRYVKYRTPNSRE